MQQIDLVIGNEIFTAYVKEEDAKRIIQNEKYKTGFERVVEGKSYFANNLADIIIKPLSKNADIYNICITKAAQEGVYIADLVPGAIFLLGDLKFIILDHFGESTLVIAKDPDDFMLFGESNDYNYSTIRKYCNSIFYDKIKKFVEYGNISIKEHSIDLTAEDGTRTQCYKSYNNPVSILTTNQYRKYRQYLPGGNDYWYWTATPVNSDNNFYQKRVCVVRSDGTLGWQYCNQSPLGAVRPVLYLNNDTKVRIPIVLP